MNKIETFLIIMILITYALIVLKPFFEWYFTVLFELVRLTIQLLRGRRKTKENNNNDGHDNL